MPLLSACGPKPDPDAYKSDPAFSLFMTRCSACHHYSLPLSKNHNAADWGRIVNRMAAKKGANLSEEEMSQIIRFLTTYRGA